MTVTVTGAGGFIGGHLVKRLLKDGYGVRAVDIKPLSDWYQVHHKAANRPRLDLRRYQDCLRACDDAEVVYNLACDMGGIGYIEANKLACQLSVLISTQMLMAADQVGVDRFFYASSACVYPARLQGFRRDVRAEYNLKESWAYPADPEDGYGWEKLFSERTAQHFGAETDLKTRIGRLHNVYGPNGTWDGGREKAPAAICRKVATAKLTGASTIEIWGSGEQQRSFCYVDDAVEGIRRLADSPCAKPLNIGSAEMVSVNKLVSIVEHIAGVTLERTYDSKAATGVHGRNSDNTMIRLELGWEPSISLRDGLAATYAWIEDEVRRTI